jgi:hypothetical protein
MAEICIKIFDNREEAELFRTFLEDQGVESYLISDNSKEYDSFNDENEGVKLIIDERDMLEVQKIIEESCEEGEIYSARD